jgi:hypothetical protein
MPSPKLPAILHLPDCYHGFACLDMQYNWESPQGDSSSIFVDEQSDAFVGAVPTYDLLIVEVRAPRVLSWE